MGMKTNDRLMRVGRWLTLRGIPIARRHIYFYALLALTSVVVSNMKERVIGSTAEDVAKAKQTASKIVGKQAVQALN